MFRSTIPLLSKRTGRTIVRDPRKRKVPAIAPTRTDTPVEVQQAQQQNNQPLPFTPGHVGAQRQSVGSSLGFYALAGAGMAIGFSIVGALFGGF